MVRFASRPSVLGNQVLCYCLKIQGLVVVVVVGDTTALQRLFFLTAMEGCKEFDPSPEKPEFDPSPECSHRRPKQLCYQAISEHEQHISPNHRKHHDNQLLETHDSFLSPVILSCPEPTVVKLRAAIQSCHLALLDLTVRGLQAGNMLA